MGFPIGSSSDPCRGPPSPDMPAAASTPSLETLFITRHTYGESGRGGRPSPKERWPMGQDTREAAMRLKREHDAVVLAH